jgi:hypothetical protein
MFLWPEWGRRARRHTADRPPEQGVPARGYFLYIEVLVQDQSRNLLMALATAPGRSSRSCRSRRSTRAAYQNRQPLPCRDVERNGIHLRFEALPMKPNAASLTDPAGRIVGIIPVIGGPDRRSRTAGLTGSCSPSPQRPARIWSPSKPRSRPGSPDGCTSASKARSAAATHAVSSRPGDPREHLLPGRALAEPAYPDHPTCPSATSRLKGWHRLATNADEFRGKNRTSEPAHLWSRAQVQMSPRQGQQPISHLQSHRAIAWGNTSSALRSCRVRWSLPASRFRCCSPDQQVARLADRAANHLQPASDPKIEGDPGQTAVTPLAVIRRGRWSGMVRRLRVGR